MTKRHAINCLVLLALSLGAYSNILHAPFVFDDYLNVVENPLVTDLGYFVDFDRAQADGVMPGFQRRHVGFLSYAINYRLHGYDVFGYHATNLAIHAINSLLVYAFILALFAAPGLRGTQLHNAPLAALAGAMIFALHPLQTQAVTYIAQRYASLAAMFYIGAMFCYVRHRLSVDIRSKWVYLTMALCLTALGMKTKENTFTIPFAVALLEWMFFERNDRKSWWRLAPFVAALLIIPYSLLGTDFRLSDVAQVTRLESQVPRGVYLMTQLNVVATYLRLLVLPVGQNLDYEYPLVTSMLDAKALTSVALHLSMLALSVYLFIRARRGSPVLMAVSFGILFFYLALCVESSLFPLGGVIFEHRMYLPMLGAAIIVSVLAGRSRAALYALIALALILGLATYSRNSVWANPITLWQDTVAKSPTKARAHYNLGQAYDAHGDVSNAAEHYLQAAALDASHIEARNNLGILYFKEGRYAEALQMLKEAVALGPQEPKALRSLGAAYIELGSAYADRQMVEEGAAKLSAAMQHSRPLAADYFYLGVASESLGRLEQALSQFHQALAIDPSHERALRAASALEEKLRHATK